VFNIIKTPGNYLTRELLYDSNVVFHCSVSHWQPYWEVSCSAGPVLALWFQHIYSLATCNFCVCWILLTMLREWYACKCCTRKVIENALLESWNVLEDSSEISIKVCIKENDCMRDFVMSYAGNMIISSRATS